MTGAFIGFAAAAAFILVVASRVMRLPPSAERFPLGRLVGYMGAVVVYGMLLNVALNYDLPLLRHFAGQGRRVPRSPTRSAGPLRRRCARWRCSPTRRWWWSPS